VRIVPGDFIEKADKRERWSTTDRAQAVALVSNMAGLGVRSLELRGDRMLIAETGRGFSEETVMFRPGETLLDALARLANQLQPPTPCTETKPNA